MTSTAWTAASSAAGVVGVFVVLVRHMLASARQQGARDERERQITARVAKLEDRVEGVAVIEKHIVALDTTVRGWDKRFQSLEDVVRDGFDRFDHLLRPVLKGVGTGRRAGAAREHQPERRPAVRLAPRLQPPAVQPRVLQRDGETESGAALLGGEVGQEEPLAHVVGDAGAGVGDGELDHAGT